MGGRGGAPGSQAYRACSVFTPGSLEEVLTREEFALFTFLRIKGFLLANGYLMSEQPNLTAFEHIFFLLSEIRHIGFCVIFVSLLAHELSVAFVL